MTRSTAREEQEPDTDALLDATTALIPPLLSALDALAYVGRHLHPPALMELVPGIEQFREPVAAGLEAFRAVAWPEHLSQFSGHAGTGRQRGVAGLRRPCQLRDPEQPGNGRLPGHELQHPGSGGPLPNLRHAAAGQPVLPVRQSSRRRCPAGEAGRRGRRRRERGGDARRQRAHGARRLFPLRARVLRRH